MRTSESTSSLDCETTIPVAPSFDVSGTDEQPAGFPGELLIRPRSGWVPLDLAELWRYRELIWFLALRDIQVRYKQTFFGVAWAVLQPLVMMVIFSLFFGRLAGLDQTTGSVPYPVFTFAALLPWQLFARALSESSGSVVANRGLITKVYFPRLAVPLAPLIAGLVDFAISFCMLLLLMAIFGVAPSWPVLLLPLFIVLALATSLAVALWLSALNAIYRDVQFTLGFLVQAWMFASPVAYPSSIVPQPWRWLYGLNPMASVIEGFRWSLLDGAQPPGPMLGISAVMVLVLMVSGAYYFRRMEKTFADVV